jgi:hypothetical protein
MPGGLEKREVFHQANIFRRGPAKSYARMPADFNDGTRNQFRLLTDGPYGAGGHLKTPAIPERNNHLLADAGVNRPQRH